MNSAESVFLPSPSDTHAPSPVSYSRIYFNFLNSMLWFYCYRLGCVEPFLFISFLLSESASRHSHKSGRKQGGLREGKSQKDKRSPMIKIPPKTNRPMMSTSARVKFLRWRYRWPCPRSNTSGNFSDFRTQELRALEKKARDRRQKQLLRPSAPASTLSFQISK